MSTSSSISGNKRSAEGAGLAAGGGGPKRRRRAPLADGLSSEAPKNPPRYKHATDPLTESNFDVRWAAIHRALGWDDTRKELKEILKAALLQRRHMLFNAPMGYGKLGVWALSSLLTGLPSVVVHPLVQVGIDGGLEAAALGLNSLVVDGRSVDMEAVKAVRALGTAESDLDVVFITMDQLVKLNPQLKNALIATARMGNKGGEESERRLCLLNFDEYAAMRIEGFEYRDSLLKLPDVARALSAAHPDIPLVLTDAAAVYAGALARLPRPSSQKHVAAPMEASQTATVAAVQCPCQRRRHGNFSTT